MFNVTDHLMRTADQQVWNNPEKREELWVADGSADKLRQDSPKEGDPKRSVEKVKRPLTDYEKEERNYKIKIRIAVILATIIIVAMVVLIIREGM